MEDEATGGCPLGREESRGVVEVEPMFQRMLSV